MGEVVHFAVQEKPARAHNDATAVHIFQRVRHADCHPVAIDYGEMRRMAWFRGKWYLAGQLRAGRRTLSIDWGRQAVYGVGLLGHLPPGIESGFLRSPR